MQSKARWVDIYHLKKDKRNAAVTERNVGGCIRQSLYSRFRKYETSFTRNRRKFWKMFPGERREASLQSKCWWLVEVSGSRIVREFNEIPAYLRHLTQRRRTYDQSVWINASDCIPIAPACIMRKPRCTFVRCWPTFVHLSIWQLLALRRVTTARVQRSYSVLVSPLWTLWSNTWAGLRVQSQV